MTASGRTQTAWRLGGSFLSASDDRLHFGLGATSRIEGIEARWPSRRVDRHTDLAADTAYLLREGQAQASPLRGWRRPLSFRVPLPFREPRLTR